MSPPYKLKDAQVQAGKTSLQDQEADSHVHTVANV